MGKIRNTASGIVKGRVGNTSYYYANGQQIARQARNNSNYGEEARRSVAQQTRRALWGNLVNLYKVMSSWSTKAFETKERHQTDYNKFMSVNLNASEVYLTKDEVSQGCAVVGEYVVSQGSLTPIIVSGVSGENDRATNVVCTVELGGTTTIGQIAADIIANNLGYQDGDNIAFIIFSNWADGTDFPFAATTYYELTLDTSSSELFTAHPLYGILTKVAETNVLTVAPYIVSTTQAVGFAAIHTRQDGTLKVSSQSIALIKPIIYEAYTTTTAQAAAIDSYGVDDEVPLSPSFSHPAISSVLVNGGVVADFAGSTLEYTLPVELVINGTNVSADTVTLEHDGIMYTPLVQGENSITFILGGNGTNVISIGGMVVFRVVISGIVMPEELPTRMSLRQVGASFGDQINVVTRAGIDCLNYPYQATESHPRFAFLFGEINQFDEVVESDFTSFNCSMEITAEPDQGRVLMVVYPTDAGNPCYVKYKDYIVAVFNYSNW